ncbi:MAG: hypothetical protein LJE56_10410 [Acidiferrobacterales bacterium]|jgi:hypothetical protein|nr:hypothetical protein [Acidiferrobacterales bacterium]
MPEDIPKAVMILLWLLIGVIVFGYLIMAYPTLYGIVFAIVFYGVPILIYQMMKKDKS